MKPKVLYFCYLKTDPSKWVTLGDMRMAVEMCKCLGSTFDIDLVGDFSTMDSSAQERFRVACNAHALIDMSEHVSSARYIQRSAKSLKDKIHEYSLIHVHTSKLGSMSTIRKLYPDIPMVVSYHSPPETSEVGHFYKDNLLQYLKEPNFCLVCNSRSHRLRMMDTLKVTEEEVPQLTYAYNAVTDIYKVNYDTDVLYASGTIGRITSLKKMYEVLEFFKYLHEKTGLRSYYIGDAGPYEATEAGQAYYSKCKKILCSSAVEWIPFATPEEVSAIVRQAHTYTTFSQVETFGLTLLEAALSGVPCLVFDSAGHGEIIENGMNGYKVPAPKKRVKYNEDLFFNFYAHYELARNLDPQEIRKYTLQRFNTKNLYKDFISVYQEVLR